MIPDRIASDFAAWAAAHPGVVDLLIENLLSQFAESGGDRVSSKRAIEEIRAREAGEISIMNAFSRPLADLAIERHPQLAGAIRRSARGAQGQQPARDQQPPATVSPGDLLRAGAAACSEHGVAVEIVMPDGTRLTIRSDRVTQNDLAIAMEYARSMVDHVPAEAVN